jgi:hypothetical protein
MLKSNYAAAREFRIGIARDRLVTLMLAATDEHPCSVLEKLRECRPGVCLSGSVPTLRRSAGDGSGVISVRRLPGFGAVHPTAFL